MDRKMILPLLRKGKRRSIKMEKKKTNEQRGQK